MQLPSLAKANARRWAGMIVKESAVKELDRTARRLCKAKERYQAVEAKTGVPWPVIAVIHEREASQAWWANLAQGDRWDRVSTHVPRGQGPFKSWEQAAINALNHSAPYIGRQHDWSIGNTLAQLEAYNGLGYERMGRPSPYIWSRSNQYSRGKYVADGVFSASAVDSQEGCAPILRRMMVMDPTINEKYKWDPIKETAKVEPMVSPTTHPITPIATATTIGAAATTVHYGWEWWQVGLAVGCSAVAIYLIYELYKIIRSSK